MRQTISAMVIAAGLLGFGAAAQAAPVPVASPAGIATDSLATPVQMRRGRMMRHRMMRHRMMHRRTMHRRMMRRRM